MSGYRWDPVFRVVPNNGAETVYWLTDRLTDAGMHTRVGLRYPEDKTIEPDINRDLQETIHGLRPEVWIECVILTMSDQHFLAEIESALLQPRRYAVFLSLDGGHVERRVVLSEISNAEPLKQKTVIGATFRLSVRCKSLIEEKPRMMTDLGLGAELVQNGGFEEAPGGVIQAWSGSSGVGTVATEASIIHGGASSAKVTRSDALTSFVFQNRLGRAPRTGAWYRYRGYARSSIDLALSASGPFRVAIRNETQDKYVASDGKTWAASGDLILGATLAASFTAFEAYFRIPSTFLDTDVFYLRHQGYWATGESLYYDDESIYGPVLRPGVATW